MKTINIITRVSVIIAIFSSVTITARAGTKDELSKNFKKRFQILQQYKDDGKIGETNKGYVDAIKAKYLKDKKLKKTIEAENNDRRKLYKLLAKEQSSSQTPITAEQVGKQNAILKFKKAAGSEYFKGKDGVWRTKKEMLDAAKNR